MTPGGTCEMPAQLLGIWRLGVRIPRGAHQQPRSDGLGFPLSARARATHRPGHSATIPVVTRLAALGQAVDSGQVAELSA
jgi:hypothetical protein